MQLRKAFITSIVSIILLSTVHTKIEVKAETISPIPVSKYNDFSANQDWGQPFEWGIKNAIVKGYINQPHPATKKFGNWLNPNGKLTEYQYLIMLFRYLAPADFALHEKAAKGDSWYGRPVYNLAWQLNTPFNLGPIYTPSKLMRRGDTARILASSITGKVMTELDSIQWLYDNEVSIGYTDVNGNYPKTYESFHADEILTRGQGITFLHRYSQTALPKKIRKIPTVESLRVPPVKALIETFNANNPEYQVTILENNNTTFGLNHDSTWLMGVSPYLRVLGQSNAYFSDIVADNPTVLLLAIDFLVSLPDYPLDKSTTGVFMKEAIETNKRIEIDKNNHIIVFNKTGVQWTKN